MMITFIWREHQTFDIGLSFNLILMKAETCINKKNPPNGSFSVGTYDCVSLGRSLSENVKVL